MEVDVAAAEEGVREPTLRSWRNWRAFEAGEEHRGAVEIALYSDAHLTLRKFNRVQFGPYRFIWISTRTLPRIGHAQLGLVLRAGIYDDNPEVLPDGTPRHRPKPGETTFAAYHGGDLGDELASLLSLLLGMRCRAGGIMREFDAPAEADDLRGRPVDFEAERPTLSARLGRPMIPGLARAVMLDEAIELLQSFPRLATSDSIALIRSARRFEQALWAADDDPQLAWLHLVSAIEAAADRWAFEEDPLADLRRAKPELFAALESRGDQELLSLVADELHAITGATAKFIKFTLAHLAAPPDERPGETFRVSWSKTKMRDHLALIYKWRSRALHAGVPIPGPMCEPPVVPDETGVPNETIGSWWYGDHYWDARDMPMTLSIFVHIVRGALRQWWASLPLEEAGIRRPPTGEAVTLRDQT
jgi:hypothetical protein